MLGGIYKITNIITGKVYVGSAKNFSKRWKRHLTDLATDRHSSIKLQRSYNKYGRDAFIFEVITEAPFEKEVLVQQENHYIQLLDSKANGYNIADASFGDTLTSHPNKDQIVQKRKETHSVTVGLLTELERNAKWGRPGEANGMFGKKHSIEARAAMSAASIGHSRNLGRKSSDACRALLSEIASQRTGDRNPFFGKQHSEETKAKLREQRMGVKPTNTLTVIIDGVEYQGLSDASKATGIAVPTIRHRALSPNPKFAEYSYKDYIAPEPQPRAKREGQVSPNRKAISVNGVVFSSAVEAAATLGLAKHVVYSRIKSTKFPGYFKV